MKIRKWRSGDLENRRKVNIYVMEGNFWFYKEMSSLLTTTTLKDNVKVVEYFIKVITPPKGSSTWFLWCEKVNLKVNTISRQFNTKANTKQSRMYPQICERVEDI